MTRSISCIAACVLAAAASPAAGQAVHPLDLPAGSLQQAMIALGRQAGVSIAVANPELARIRVSRVRGRLSVEQALRRMLGGTRAGFVSLGGGNYRIVPAPVRKAAPRSPPPVSQPAPPESVPDQADIIVTASKRSVQLRHYPGPATVLGGDRLEANAGTDAISDRLPSLGSTHLGPGRDKLFIRAVADSSFSGQTQATVGQYFGEARLNYNAPDPSLRLYDIASVELLAGPQGTLFGAGSMGGVLQIVPNAPDPRGTAASLTASAAVARHGDMSRELAGMINLPIADGRAALRLVAYDVDEGGYIDDSGRGLEDINRTAIRGGRLTGLWQLGGDWSVGAGGVLQSIEGDDGQYAERSEPDLTHRSLFAQPFSNDYSLVFATLRGDFGRHRMTTTVSRASQNLGEQFAFVIPHTQPTLFRQYNQLSLTSAETRLWRTRHDGTGWLVGAQILDNNTKLSRAGRTNGRSETLLGLRNSVEEQTIFGEFTLRIARPVTLTGGARLTHVRFDGQAEGRSDTPTSGDIDSGADEWRLLPSLGAGVELSDGSLLYLRYQESFRPGGLILRSNAAEFIKGDHIAAWEAGLRFGQRPNARFSGTAAFSHARWKDVQADTIDTFGIPTTKNIGDGRVHTWEALLNWKPVPGLSLLAAGTINRSKLIRSGPSIDAVIDGPLPNVPRVVARAEAEYALPLPRLAELRLSAWGRYVGKSRLGLGGVFDRSQGDYLDIGAEVRIGPADRCLFLRATNLLDKIGNRFALGSVLTLPAEDQITPLRPRTLRLGLQASF